LWQRTKSFVNEPRDGLDDVVEFESGEIRRLRKQLVAAIVQICPPWLRGQAEERIAATRAAGRAPDPIRR
jgi:hypothetical protein